MIELVMIAMLEMQTAPPLPPLPPPPPPPPHWDGPMPEVSPGQCRAVGDHLVSLVPLGRHLMDDPAMRAAIDSMLTERGGKPMEKPTPEDRANQAHEEQLVAAVVERYHDAKPDFNATLLAMRMPYEMQLRYAESCLGAK